MNLINDILIRAGIITEISNGATPQIVWFKNITFMDFAFTYIIPLCFFLALAFYLKSRYNKKRERDEITLRPFLNLDPPKPAV